MENKLDNINHELFSGGGMPQAMNLLMHLFCAKTSSFSMEDILRMIGREFDSRCKQLTTDYIIPIDLYDYIAKDGEKYVCFDKKLKFCVKEKGTDEWKNVAFVLPHYDVTKAIDLIYKHTKNKI